MSSEFQVLIITASQVTVARFASERLVIENVSSPSQDIQVGEVTHVPGAIGGWYELAIGIGLTALPVSVLASCLATWITNSMAEAPAPSVKVKLVLQKGDRNVGIELNPDDAQSLADALLAALDDVGI